MSNYEDYFLARIAGPDSLVGMSKLDSLQEASRSKIADLTKLKAEQQIREAARAQSLAGQMGLEPGGVTGDVVNGAASVISGTTRLAGSVLAAPFSGLAGANQSNLTEDDIAALGRIERGEQTDEDLVRVSRKVAPIVNAPPTIADPAMRRQFQAQEQAKAQALADQNPNAPTPSSIWAEMNKSRETARGIVQSADNSQLIQQDARQAFTADLNAAYAEPAVQVAKGWKEGEATEVVAGIAKLLFSGGAAVLSNKQATAEYVLENLPQLFVGAMGTPGRVAQVVDNISAAADHYNKGILEYQAKNGGALPPEDVRQRMAIMTAAHAGAEQLGDTAGLAATKLLGSAAKDVSRASFKSALKGTAEAVGKGIISEAPTEGFQQYAEGEITGTPATGAEIYGASVIGAASGGALSGGGRAATEAARLVAQPSAPKVRTEPEIAAAAAQETAINTGDVAALLDSKSKLYSPERAIAALKGFTTKEGIAPEAREANIKKVDEIVAGLEAEKVTLEEKLATVSPEVVDGYKDMLVQAKASGASADQIAQYEDAIRETPKDAAALTLQLGKLNEHLTGARKGKAQFDEMVRPAPESITALIAEANESPKEGNDALAAGVAGSATPAVRVISLAMRSPESFEPGQATQLADNLENGLTEPQRVYLRAFDAARLADNAMRDMGDVTQEIYFGTPATPDGSVKHRGVSTYRAQMNEAVSAFEAGNTKAKGKAESALNLLGEFAADHEGKAAAAEKALSTRGLGSQILRKPNVGTVRGEWYVNTGPLVTSAEILKSGSQVVKSPRLVATMRSEANSLKAAQAELAAVFDLKFTPTPSTPNEAANVQNEAQPGTPTEIEAATAEKPAAEQAGSVAAPARDGTANEPAVGVAGVAGQQTGGVKTEDTQEPVGSSVVAEATPVTAETPVELTEDSGVDNQSTKSTTVEAEPTAVAETGKLDVLTKKSPEGTAYQERNLLADYTVQDAGKKGSASLRPLVAVKNFLTAMSNDMTIVKDFLGVASMEEITKAQLDFLSTFGFMAQKWAPVIQRGLGLSKDPLFKFRDSMQFLVQELQVDGKSVLDVEENVKTAIAVAATAFIVEDAAFGAFNTQKDINLILGRDEDTDLSSEEQSIFGNRMSHVNVVRNKLGAKAREALGFKVTSKDAPTDMIARLDAALGAHVQKLLMDQGIMTLYSVSNDDLTRLRGNTTVEVDTAANDKANALFLGLAWTKQGKGKHVLQKDAQDLLETSRKTQGILTKLFSVESGLVEPSLEPITFTQKTPADTQQGIPSLLVKAVTEKQAEARFVHQDKWNVLSQMDDGQVMMMAGTVGNADGVGTHANNLKKNQAKNDGLLREWHRFQDFMSGTMGKAGIESPIYFAYSVWKQQRVGISTNAVNPQMSKMHRYMVYAKDWVTEVKLSDDKTLNLFKLVVMEGLGVNIGKKANAKSLTAFDSLFNETVTTDTKEDRDRGARAVLLNKAIAGLIAGGFEGKDLTDAQKQDIAAGVQAGGENFQSLDALMAMAHYRAAVEGDFDKFTTAIMGEVDGVNNGPMLSFLFYGAARTTQRMFSWLNRGGFYEKGSPHTQHNQWRGEPGNYDLYETMAIKMMDRVREILGTRKGSFLAPVFGAVEQFTKPLAEAGVATKAGRNIIKTPINALSFGSAVYTSVLGMAEGFMDSIYERIEAAHALPAEQQAEEAWRIQDALNILLEHGGGYELTGSMSVDDLLAWDPTARGGVQRAAIMKAFMNTLGNAAQDTLKAEFEDYLAQRDALNETAQLSFVLYDAAYSGLRKEYVEEMMAQEATKPGTGIPFALSKGVRVPRHDLTPAQEGQLRDRLKKIQPLIHTAMSKQDGKIENGLLMAKTGKQISKKETYRGETLFGTGMKGAAEVFNVLNKRNQLPVRVNTSGYESTMTSPTVGTGSKLTHSSDSTISHTVQLGNQVINNHDALGMGLASYSKVAKQLNAAVWDTMLNYSPVTEMYDAYARQVAGLAEMIEKAELSPAAIDEITAAVKKFAEEQSEKKLKAGGMAVPAAGLIQAFLERSKTMAFMADSMKFITMAEMAIVDQYASENGNHEVTEEQRADAEALWKAATGVVPEADMKNAKILDAAMTVGLPVLAVPAVPVDRSPFGVLLQKGETPDVESDKDLVAFFKQNPQATMKQVIGHLYTKISAQPAGSGNREFNLKLLKVLSKSGNQKLMVNLVTRTTALENVVGMPKDPALGWYGALGGDEAIYVVGNDFKHSNIQAEVLLHEMVHAASAYRLTTSAGKEFGAELNSLLDEVRTWTKAQGITKFDAALTNVDELIAYGMTSAAFQREVLAKVSMKSGTKGKMKTALRGFIDLMARLIGFADADSANGLGVLITNAVALMEQGAAEQNSFSASLPMSAAAAVNTYSTMDVYEAINDGRDTVSPAFDGHLRGLLTSIVEKLHGTFGSFKADLMANQAGTAEDVWLKALATGRAPFASSSLAAGFRKFSAQEAYVNEQVEATVRAALNANDASARGMYKELSALYTEVEKWFGKDGKEFHPGDWATANATQKAQAKALYDFIFKLEKSNGDISDYLARFAAMGLANESFNGMLKAATAKDTRRIRDGKTVVDRLRIIFEKVLNLFGSRLVRYYAGQNADEKLAILVEQLVDIEAKRKATLERKLNERRILEPVEEGVRKATDYLKDKIVAGAGSQFIRNNRSAAVQLGGSLTRLVVGDRVDFFLEELRKFQQKNSEGRQGIVAALIQEFKGQDPSLQTIARITKMSEGDRKDKMSRFADLAMKSFVDGGKKLSEAARDAITPVFLRTGAHHLLGKFTTAEIENLLGNRAALDAAVTDYENQLNTFGRYAQNYRLQANGLAFQKATGIARTKFVHLNGHNIARAVGTAYTAQITPAQVTQAQPIIEALVALYALRYTDAESLALAKGVLQAENARTDDENGVEFVLKLHKRLEIESLERAFKGNPVLMTHGYTSEIYDPHTDIVTANTVEGKDLMDRGYKQGAVVWIDPADSDQSAQRIYVLTDGGLAPHATGAISYSDLSSKGKDDNNGYRNLRTATGVANVAANAAIAASRHAEMNSLAQPGPVPDLSQGKGNYMVPVFNDSGDVVKWRYMMAETTKDALLKRDNRFDKVLGTIAASIYDKQTTPEQNKNVISALLEIYKVDGPKNPEGYALVGSKSTDAELRGFWDLLPEQTKKDVKTIWGTDGVWVRKDNMDIIFGYRKLSAADMFKRADKERVARAAAGLSTGVMSLDSINLFQKVMVSAVESVLIMKAIGLDHKSYGEAEDYAKRSAVVIARSERMWQELVSEAKDIIVVKSMGVMLNNIKSNLWLLGMSGVPVADIARHHLVAWNGAREWQRDSKELEHLRALRDSGYTKNPSNAQDIDRSILRLEDLLQRNPVRELMEAGLMPTIVEDLTAEDDRYSYKSIGVRKVEKYTKRLPDAVVKAAKFMYMSHDGVMYKTLHEITQLSDFVARYTLYQHLISRRVNPLSKDDAVQKASDTFINYDVPMHRTLQYLDDVGLMMFTKYLLRVQKVIVKTTQENPARVLTTVLLDNLLGIGPTVLDSAIWGRLGNNPFSDGAFKFFSSLDQLATVNSVMSLLSPGSAAATVPAK